MSKIFLDEQGLSLYDQLIKAYVQNLTSSNLTAVNMISEMATQNKADIATLKADEETEGSIAKAIKDAINTQASDQTSQNTSDIETLNGGEETEGSVKNIAKKAAEDAVASIVDSAPEALDTLKEVAEWIANDETGTAKIVADIAQVQTDIQKNADDIAENTQAINDLKSYVNTQDQAVLNSINSIQDLEIKSLFMEKVNVASGESVSDAITNLQSGQMIILAENDSISEDFTVPEGVIIDANGATLSGNITVAEGAEITNAVFTGVVTIQ